VKSRPLTLLTLSARALGALLLLAPSLAAAQEEPKFEFAKAEAPKPNAPPAVEWTAQAKAGGLLMTGNSQVESATLGALATRKQGSNKLSLDGNLTYGRSNVWQAVADPNTPLVIDGLKRTTITSANNWLIRARYDRFFTLNNAGYASAQSGADHVAGKEFFGGGQVGYSRQLVNNAMNLFVAELGYDFSYESYEALTGGKVADPVSIHSARLFAGETLTLSKATGLTASVEAFFNLNKESKALNHVDGSTGVDPFKDTRVVAKAALTTTVVKSLSIAVGFRIRYDQNPAPLPIASLIPMNATLSPTAFSSTMGVPFAQTLDTQTEATLIYTFF
jgi:hypothetical protein